MSPEVPLQGAFVYTELLLLGTAVLSGARVLGWACGLLLWSLPAQE